MTVFYHIGDLEFRAATPQELKKELEEYFLPWACGLLRVKIPNISQ